jgi:hypothetical protein
MEHVLFYDLLKYFTTIWCNVLPFCIVCSYLLYFFLLFVMFGPRKIWQPWCRVLSTSDKIMVNPNISIATRRGTV